MAADHKSGISISGKEDLKDGNPNLTYSISGKCKGIDDKEVRDIIARAFKVWADVSLLTFRPVDADANIKLSFEDGDHFTEGDPTHSNPLSKSETGGLIHFDDDENWKGMKDQSKGGINLFLAAVHEIGHVLGLPDKDFQKTTMYKSYANDKTFALNRSDIEIIQKKWGANLSQVGTYDGITEIQGELHLFKNGKYFRVKTSTGKNSEIEGPFEMSKKWPFLPETIDAVFENRFKKTMYFFSGKFYWECPENGKEKEHALSDLGLPNTITKVDAGLWWRENTALILSGTKCWEVNVATGSVENSFPRDINELFRDAPSMVDNFFNFQGQMYLSREGTFSRIDTRNGYKVDKTGNLKKELLNASTKDK